LCGVDSLSGRSFEHRKFWLQDRLAFLAGQMALDVLGFAVMSDHLHIVVRNRPDVAERWSDDDVARR
jgi:REP element-mobilizing transposase RayT